jgi:hypothetical protein
MSVKLTPRCEKRWHCSERAAAPADSYRFCPFWVYFILRHALIATTIKFRNMEGEMNQSVNAMDSDGRRCVRKPCVYCQNPLGICNLRGFKRVSSAVNP